MNKCMLTATSYSEILGYEKFSFSSANYPNPVNILTNPFIHQPIYSGNASVSNNTFIIPNIISNNIVETPFYIEIISTNYNGYIFDIISNKLGVITAYNIPNNLNGQIVSIKIRQHFTLGQIISQSTGLQDYSDALSLTNNNGDISSFYYTADGILGDDYYTPANNTIVDPNEPILINNCGNINIILYGESVNN